MIALAATILAAAAAAPLVVTETALSLPNAALVDRAPLDGIPDGWTWSGSAGRVRVSPMPGPGGSTATKVSYEAGTRGQLCSGSIAVTPGRTVVVGGAVRGDPKLADVTALHVHIGNERPSGGGVSRVDAVVAKRRFDKGDYPWEPIEVTATVPAGADRAWVCAEVVIVPGGTAGSFWLTPLTIVERAAESRQVALSPRRVILVTVEAFRRDHVHAYGYPRQTTPTLDRLIAEGTSFDRHRVQAPYTHPSLAALLTGLMPGQLGFADNRPVATLLARSLPESLAAAGYVTAAWSSQYVLSNRYGLNRGFHYYRNHPNDTSANALHLELMPFLDEHEADNLFLWIHYFEPHGPYRPPANFRARFSADETWTRDPAVLRHSPETAEGVPLIPNYVYDKDQFERRHYVAGYDGDIAWFDQSLGQLVQFLRDRGWERDTLLLFTADHGESMTEHARFFCHGSLYEHDLHVPMVAWGAGVPAGRRVDARTQHVDIAPTLLEMVGQPAPTGSVGRSFLSALRGGTHVAAPISVAMRGKEDNLRFAAVGDNGIKIVVDAGGSPFEAYDLVADPGETQNLAGMRPALVGPVVAQFKEWLRISGGMVAPRPEQALDPEDAAMLRALGYIQ